MDINKVGEDIRMDIHDNGKSFDVEKVLYAKRHKRLGVLGMRERVQMVGGDFSIESKPGHGTTVRAQIPISDELEAPKAARKSVRRKVVKK
jgi:signal transduction histidine kinase